MKINYRLLAYIFLLFIKNNLYSQNKILFDATKAESAGNADWIIDADSHNLGWGNSGGYIGGSDSNAQRFPTPAQSGITTTTIETYWNGALSYWAIDCVKKGYQVETLPFGGSITYGNSSNLQDLSNYKAFVVDEPNILFTAAEKTAILNYVANGGGLFMIADHDISDRNNDGNDSPHIWNDLMTNNTIANNPFGISFDYVNISGTYNNIANLPTDPILHGTTGNVTQVMWSGGTTMTINTTQNPTIKGVVFKTGASNTGTTNVLCAYGNYGNGKVAAVGDSSITDDGTGDTNDTLYDGYITDANGNHQKLLMNITNWLMAQNLETEEISSQIFKVSIAPNPIINNNLSLSFFSNKLQNIEILIFDNLGRIIEQIPFTIAERDNSINLLVNNLTSGIYFCKINSDDFSKTLQFVIK